MKKIANIAPSAISAEYKNRFRDYKEDIAAESMRNAMLSVMNEAEDQGNSYDIVALVGEVALLGKRVASPIVYTAMKVNIAAPTDTHRYGEYANFEVFVQTGDDPVVTIASHCGMLHKLEYMAKLVEDIALSASHAALRCFMTGE